MKWHPTRKIIACIVLTMSQYALAQYEEDIDLINEIALASKGIQQEFEAHITSLDAKEHLLAASFLRTSQNVHDTEQHARTILLLIEVVDPSRIHYATQFFNADVAMFNSVLTRDVDALRDVAAKTRSDLVRKSSEDLLVQVIEFQRLMREIRGKGK
jgi:hypothetical protein